MLMTNPKGTTILGIRVFKIMTLGISEYKCSKNYSSYLILDHFFISSWSNSFCFRREWSKVLGDEREIQGTREVRSVPSLLFNPEETLMAPEYNSEVCDDNNAKQYYYFENITSMFEKNQASFYLFFVL